MSFPLIPPDGAAHLRFMIRWWPGLELPWGREGRAARAANRQLQLDLEAPCDQRSVVSASCGSRRSHSCPAS